MTTSPLIPQGRHLVFRRDPVSCCIMRPINIPRPHVRPIRSTCAPQVAQLLRLTNLFPRASSTCTNLNNIKRHGYSHLTEQSTRSHHKHLIITPPSFSLLISIMRTTLTVSLLFVSVVFSQDLSPRGWLKFKPTANTLDTVSTDGVVITDQPIETIYTHTAMPTIPVTQVEREANTMAIPTQAQPDVNTLDIATKMKRVANPTNTATTLITIAPGSALIDSGVVPTGK